MTYIEIIENLEKAKGLIYDCPSDIMEALSTAQDLIEEQLPKRPA